MESRYDKDFMIRYLLGELSESEKPEQERFEKAYFTDDELFDELEAVENDLIDRYVRGELAQELNQRFEDSLGDRPARKKKVEFARVIAVRSGVAGQVVTEEATQELFHSSTGLAAAPAADASLPQAALVEPEKHEFGRRSEPEKGVGPRLVWVGFRFDFRRWFPQIALAACAVAIAFATWTTVKILRLRNQLRQKRAELAVSEQHVKELRLSLQSNLKFPTLAPEQLRKGVKSGSLGKSLVERGAVSRRTVTFVLATAFTRGAESQAVNKLVISKRTARVRLSIRFEGSLYPSYRVVLETPDGTVINHWNFLKGRMLNSGLGEVIAQMPASSIKSGDYILRLGGVRVDGKGEEVQTYSLRVLKE